MYPEGLAVLHCFDMSKSSSYSSTKHPQRCHILKLLVFNHMQENEYKSHHVIISHLSLSWVLPTHLNINATK